MREISLRNAIYEYREIKDLFDEFHTESLKARYANSKSRIKRTIS